MASEARVTTPYDVIEELRAKEEKIKSLIVLVEWDDDKASMLHTAMPPRDLWWNLTNACIRVWHMIGGV